MNPISNSRVVKSTTSSTKRSKGKDYEFDRKFSTKEDALKLIDAEKCWSKNGVPKKTLIGLKQFYRCNLVRTRDPVQCESRLYLLYHISSTQVSLFRTISDHTHQDKSNEKLSDPLKNDIIYFYHDLFIRKPEAIIRALEKKYNTPDFRAPTKDKIKNVLQNCKRKMVNSKEVNDWNHLNNGIMLNQIGVDSSLNGSSLNFNEVDQFSDESLNESFQKDLSQTTDDCLGDCKDETHDLISPNMPEICDQEIRKCFENMEFYVGVKQPMLIDQFLQFKSAFFNSVIKLEPRDA